MPNGTVWLLTENDGAIRILTHPDENHRLTWDIYSNKTELFPSLHVFKVHQDKAGNDWLLTDNGLGMIRPGDKEPVSYFTETKGKLSGMNQAFYAVQERDEDICFASDHGRVWVYQKGSGEFVLLELPTKGRITSIHTVAPDMSVITTDSDLQGVTCQTHSIGLCRPFFGSLVRTGRTGCGSSFQSVYRSSDA